MGSQGLALYSARFDSLTFAERGVYRFELRVNGAVVARAPFLVGLGVPGVVVE
jgi:hypothetical protein